MKLRSQISHELTCIDLTRIFGLVILITNANCISKESLWPAPLPQICLLTQKILKISRGYLPFRLSQLLSYGTYPEMRVRWVFVGEIPRG